jgi:dTDP-glucose 4,6-dehydratase
LKIIVTGGAGFIGSAVCRYLIGETSWSVVNLDRLTYAANLASLATINNHPRYRFVKGDIGDRRLVRALLSEVQPDAILNLAAESHVDRSIDDAAVFIQTNVVGTYALPEEALRYWQRLSGSRRDGFRVHHVSTDEVFGALGPTGFFTEATPYRPSSPYSASKAASDHLVRAWGHTFGLPVIITNCSNNYGPFQHPEKLIPMMILRGLRGERLPVYGRGENIRDWLHVDDHARALMTVLENASPGSTFNIGSRSERRNIEIVHEVCDVLDEFCGALPSGARRTLVAFVEDRPGHDFRYAIDPSPISETLGWKPKFDVTSGLRATVRWYLENEAWWLPMVKDTRVLARQGVLGE